MAIRVVFLGMRCAASEPPLAALLAARFDLRAVVLAAVAPPTPQSWGEDDGAPAQRAPTPPSWGEPEPAAQPPASPPPRVPAGRSGEGLGEGADRSPPRIGGPGGPSAVETLAAGAGVPVVQVAGMGEETVAAVAAYRPEAVVVACFPWRLPAAVLALPRLGCLNVHPSLLPRGRGPAPVFWTLRRGERRTGATVHLMDDRFDAGPVVAQAAIEVAEGIRAPALERRLMALGGRLLVGALPRLAGGAITPVPQDDALATTAPLPTAADFAVPTNLPAGWAYRFVRGVAPLGGPLAVHVGATGERLAVRDALALAAAGHLTEPVVAEGDGTVRVRFRPGWVRFRL